MSSVNMVGSNMAEEFLEKNEYTCSICRDTLKTPVYLVREDGQLSCSKNGQEQIIHNFCQACILQVKETCCPLCRSNFHRLKKK